jgi:hypothetical protein
LPEPIPNRTTRTRLRALPAALAAPAAPQLAVWLDPEQSRHRLSDRLTRRLIEHYTDPGDLILADRDAEPIALRLHRRAHPLVPVNPEDAPVNVVTFPCRDLARFALLQVTGRDLEPAIQALIARLASGAFVALAPRSDARTLGRLVETCEANGLRYWQHIVVFDPAATGAADAAPVDQTEPTRRDVLVLRQEAQASQVGAIEAAA